MQNEPIAGPIAGSREYHRQRNLANNLAGKCRCGQPRAEGFTRCPKCVESSRVSTKNRIAKRRSTGVCHHCGKPSDGQSRCERCREVGRLYQRRLKARVIEAYGGKCNCCGEGNLSFLTIDHTNGDGGKHRQAIGSSRIYNWLENRGYPTPGFQVLCFNCNCGRQINGGVCPHQTRSQELGDNKVSPSEGMALCARISAWVASE